MLWEHTLGEVAEPWGGAPLRPRGIQRAAGRLGLSEHLLLWVFTNLEAGPELEARALRLSRWALWPEVPPKSLTLWQEEQAQGQGAGSHHQPGCMLASSISRG